MRCGAMLVTTLCAAGLLVGSPATAFAASPACAAASAPAAAAVPLSGATLASVAAYRAVHDTVRLPVDLAASVPAAVAAQVARRAAARRAPVRLARAAPAAPCAASGRIVLANLDQQGQITDYYCGPATVSEMAATRGLRVDQGVAARWMGTGPSSGTSVDQLTRGLNQFVGWPGGGTYAFVSLSYSPTPNERAAFVARLRSDLTTYGGWPVAGDAWEVPGGPHLVGHPDVEIFHWIEIGGMGDGDTVAYYADSATTVWSGVPAYSWIDLGALVAILGGRGYAW
ncbi:MAG TPA: hypothetical protein VIC57_01160 [Candidatus Dormibacteraeota bacterium]